MTPTSLGLLLLWAAATGEVPRPDEADLFGSGSPATAEPASADPAQGAEPPPSASPTDRDAAALAGDAGRDAFATGEAVEDPLVIGGLYYQQLIAAGRRATPVDKAPLAMPFQFDGFFDARPNDRLRGFIDMRLVYDPTRDAFGNVTGGTSLGSLQTNSTATAPTGLGGAASAAPTNPQAVLNEAWIKFDIERTLFVTAGKQHVKWGASRYWNPTDLLNPQRRDPLLPYDLRLGATMLRLGLPFEASQSALYAVASYDNPTAASTLGQLSGAGRGETVLGEAEVGLDMIWRHGFSPVLGADL
ncbi:MAG TPA: hypothetical protein VFH51_10520, partial [Myxococcota bacterium]|nr:hypothetical protein [Myxococcota bacterium]